MKNPGQWLPLLESKLRGGETLRVSLGGEFIDRPKSMRTGLLALTDQRLVFYRKKTFGEEFLSFDINAIDSSEIGEFANLIGPNGGIPELRVSMRSGQVLRMTMVQHGSAEDFHAALPVAGT